ncbi:unnamed protein product [Eruca vesicaria subsp. sativa]|uniref:F-box/LRR-repeat protein 15/At3g58940/PEG3-like LRR domain-containing protein n=1 Tax=Eruca vesicaria subsp. sativa TaxID=29727 RepID=A0ABC8JV96_ERUVS|nr:unnamed protein product [Eruca vesicaria subsp. sativa]
MSRSVHKLSVSFRYNYTCPDFFFLSSSLEQLHMNCAIMICTPVSWKSLRNLTLNSCKLSDDKAVANILSGCPVLENLELFYCLALPQRLDLSKSLNLRRLEIRWSCRSSYPLEIIAPQIRYLKVIVLEEPCTLVDVSSVTEANLEICIQKLFFTVADFVQIRVLKMLEKLQNVERLTFGRTLLQMLSLAELRGITFPMLKVHTLIVETMIVRSAIPGITRLLQNSPVLTKLIAQATCSGNINDHTLDYYLGVLGLNPDQCWRSEYIHNFPTSEGIFSMVRCENAASKLFTSFMELVLRNSKTLETMVIRFRPTPALALECFAQLLQMPPTLPHNDNVSIVLNPSNHSLIASVSLS